MINQMNKDDHKICFISCTNNEKYEKECLLYINQLIIPMGYSVDILTVHDAKSMAAGYNEGMNASDAKYKVYLHQDVFIRNKNFISDILSIFEEESIGLIGMVGAKELSTDGVMWNAGRCGNFQLRSKKGEHEEGSIRKIKGKYEDVVCVDGLLMATQYDIKWREDLFKNWDFYDISQCGEFIKEGFRVVTAGQMPYSWVFHDCGLQKMENYETNRKIFLDNYSDVFKINRNKIRVIEPFSKEINISDICWGLIQNGYEAIIQETGITHSGREKHEADLMSYLIRRQHADCAFTYDFSPYVSSACMENHIKYIVWTYDTPLEALCDENVNNECNYFFCFDKVQYNELKNQKRLKHVFYMPLAANVTRIGIMVISKKEEKKYKCNVSFIGQLYSKNIYEDCEKVAAPKTKKEYDSIISNAYGIWDGKDRVQNSLSEESMEDLMKISNDFYNPRFYIDRRMIFESRLLSQRIAYLERIEMLRRLNKFGVRFYTNEENLSISGINPLPPLDYERELGKAYYLSKININMTLHTITSGIPLRVFDIMGSGGFMLTNYQPEIEELFTPGKDIAVYHNLDEMEEMVRYYLDHDKERIRIAMNGYKRVRDNYSFDKRIKAIMEMAGPIEHRE